MKIAAFGNGVHGGTPLSSRFTRFHPSITVLGEHLIDYARGGVSCAAGVALAGLAAVLDMFLIYIQYQQRQKALITF